MHGGIPSMKERISLAHCVDCRSRMVPVRAYTVLMGTRKEIFIEIHYFHVLTSPLGRKFQTDSKNDRNKFDTISEGHDCFDQTFVGWPQFK